MLCDVARNLDGDDLRHIQDLERALGLTIVAFTCRSLDPEREERIRRASEELGLAPHVEPAEADEQQLRLLRETEDALGVSLVAVRP